ncbi:MAG: PQQ-binding-like beta-propeller repeat protein [Pirellulales bacterium]
MKCRPGFWLLLAAAAVMPLAVGCAEPSVDDSRAGFASGDESEGGSPGAATEKEAAEGDASAEQATDPSAEAPASSGDEGITMEWKQWGGSAQRNNTPVGHNIPTEWHPGDFDPATGEWISDTAKNIKWVARLGSQSYGNAVVADGKVFVGTNNGAGWLERYPPEVDLGCLLAFDLEDGSFLWQHSSEKLPTGRVHDWPLQGICCAPYVEGDRLWFVTSRGEVRCLDTEGFRDGENDGPHTEESHATEKEADVIWVLDMMDDLKISQHNMCSCSVTAAGDILFVNTSNGMDESHINLPAPDAPSFVAMDKNTGEVLWTDGSPGVNILHGQWSSPAFAVLDGVPQVIFAGGDGWVYSFLGERTEDGQAKLLWKFDANPKESKWILGGRGTRNNIIATPVIHDGLVYVAVGQDPEHDQGVGHLWCIDPTKRGDVGPELAFKLPDLENPIPHRREQAVIAEEGEVVRPNPNSAVVWHFSEFDKNENGEIEFEETMNRSCGTVAIKDGLLFIADFSGLFHCLDAKTGKPHWTYDMFAAAWGSPLIVEDKVYIGDDDGDVAIFRVSADPNVAMKDDGGQLVPISEINMGNSVYSTPIVADNVLYISNRTHLFAIAQLDDAQLDDAQAEQTAASGQQAAD